MSSSYSLLCYTRKPTGREEANNADVALSMHLALRVPTVEASRMAPNDPPFCWL